MTNQESQFDPTRPELNQDLAQAPATEPGTLADAAPGTASSSVPATTEPGTAAGTGAPALDPEQQKAFAKFQKEQKKVKGSVAASTWIALILGFLLLILLIIFMLQNQQSVEMNFFTWSGQFPAGIAFLIFAIGGALIMALVGGLRMFELRRQLSKAKKAQAAQSAR